MSVARSAPTPSWSGLPDQAATTVGRPLLTVIAVLGPFFFGSNTPLGAGMLAVAAGLALVVTALAAPSSRLARRLFALSMLLVLLLAGLALLQSGPTPIGGPEHPAWAEARAVLGPVPGSIAAVAGEPLRALPGCAAPVCLFAAALALTRNDEAVLATWRHLVHTTAALALVTLAQRHLTPGTLLWAPKLYYTDSFTLTYINRNTAATHLGVTLLAASALFYRDWRRTGFDLGALIPDAGPGGSRPRPLLVLHAATLALLFVALVSTRSRAGLVATLLGLAVFWVPVLWSSHLAGRARGPALAALGAIATAAVWIFGGLVLSRFDAEGTVDSSRACTFAATIAIFLEHPILGTGLGTFQDVFPAYRDLDCDIHGYWDKAHSTYLEALQSAGLAGGALLGTGLAALVWAVRHGWRSRKRYRFVAAATGGMVAVAATHALVDFSLQIPGFAVYLAVLLGSGLGSCLMRDGPREAGSRADGRRGRTTSAPPFKAGPRLSGAGPARPPPP
ncbi:O-antigen ligase family protein [Prosthecomicrobium sp. N25]|uniref:O-antigen ligase family protein n=1 Tax=Prosthecomicrobium sp. N25 TaxID=3129254 RepID=UPI00307869A6